MDAPAFNDLYDSGGVAKLQRPRSLSKNAFSTKLSEVKGAAKASKPHSSAYSGTVPETHTNKDKARSFLRTNNVSEATIEAICQIIDEISYRGNDSVIPKTLAGKCVQDSDRLDAIGAIGIARAFAYGGNHNRVMHNPNISPNLNMDAQEYHNHISTTINHFYEKLFKLKDLMNTDTAKLIAQDREKYMKEYISEFMDEWEGIR